MVTRSATILSAGQTGWRPGQVAGRLGEGLRTLDWPPVPESGPPGYATGIGDGVVMVTASSRRRSISAQPREGIHVGARTAPPGRPDIIPAGGDPAPPLNLATQAPDLPGPGPFAFPWS